MILRRDVIALRSLSGGRISLRMPSRNCTRRLFLVRLDVDIRRLLDRRQQDRAYRSTGASPAWFSRSTTLTFSSVIAAEVDVIDIELADHLVEVRPLS